MAAQEKERLKRWEKLDFYGALGLQPSASTADVKKGFRKVALTCHPDKVAPEEREAATRRFQLIAEAYEVLANAASRQKYDSVRPRNAGRVQQPPPHASGSRAGGAGAGGGYPSAGNRPDPRQRVQPEARPRDPFEGGWHRCDGCDRRVQLSEMRNCKQCDDYRSAGLLCSQCDMCAGCIPNDIPSRYGRQPAGQKAPKASANRNAARAQPQNMPRAEPSKAEQPRHQEAGTGEHPGMAPGWKARPLHEDLAEFWVRIDRKDKPRTAPKAAPARNAATEAHAPKASPDAARVAPARPSRSDPRAEADPAPADLAADGADDDLDNLDILMAMGFDETRAKAALSRCSTVEAAVEDIMQNSSYLNQAGNAVQGAAARASAGFYGAVIQPMAQKIYGEENSGEVFNTLLSLGFTDNQARCATERCSSVEAAVEWITTHPEVG